MALFHRATIKPTKAELIARWVPTQPWGSPPDVPIEVIGSYRFDDPDGRVGMENHLVTAGGTLMHVPLTYRDQPLDGAADALVTEMVLASVTEMVDPPTNPVTKAGHSFNASSGVSA